MKLVTFTHAGRTRLGAVESDAVVALHKKYRFSPDFLCKT